MSAIQVRKKDGTVKDFPDGHRPGGSWTNSIRYEVGFVVVTDVWGNETAIPSADIDEIKTTPNRGRW